MKKNIKKWLLILAFIGGYSSVILAGDFTDNGDGTVTEEVYGLIWQQAEAGQKTWEAALTYCEGLSLAGKSDWRLPNIRELETIVDTTKYNPAINTTAFPNANSSSYWSSTTVASISSYAWPVDFQGGRDFSYGKKSNIYVRCVRSGE